MVERKGVTVSLYDRHIYAMRKLAKQAQVSDSEIIRELLELASNCDAIFDGVFLRFQRPKYQWEAQGRYL